MAETTPNYGNADSYSAEASATIKARNCLEVSGTSTVAPTAGPGGAFAGVAAYDVPKGELVTVRTTGVHTLRCTGNIAAGARVTTAPGGAVTVGEPAIGIAQSPSVGGAVRVKLIAPGGGSAGGGGGGGAAWADVHAAAEKVTPDDADDFPLMDSAAAWGLKRVTWGSFKTAFVNWYNAAVKVLTNTTLTTPTINGGKINGATADNMTGAVKVPVGGGTVGIEVVGTTSWYSVGANSSAGTGMDPTFVIPGLFNSIPYLLMAGGTLTSTINGTPATPTGVENMFNTATQFCTWQTTATTDVVVIEVDFSNHVVTPRIFQPIIMVESRAPASARDITTEVWDGTAWTVAGSVQNSPTGVFVSRSAASNVSKVRITCTNLRSTAGFSINHLAVVASQNSPIEAYGALLTRAGGNVYGSAAKPAGFQAIGVGDIPFKIGAKGAADVVDGNNRPFSTLVPAPASLTAAGRPGQFAFSADGTKVYFCTATNVWRSAALTATL